MAVTNYDIIAGSILGENTGGTQTDYLTDALGSVSATLSATGSILNEYEYAPYGTQISKTGTSADPDFLWIGSQGYRTTALTYASHYVRARTYDSTNGRWTSVDPAWPDLPAYGYASERPVLLTDPSGAAVEITRSYVTSTCNKCGDFTVEWAFTVGQQTPDGWLIQEITNLPASMHNCGGPCQDQDCFFCDKSFIYYEAWRVEGGIVKVPKLPGGSGNWQPPQGFNDIWGQENEPALTYGSTIMLGVLGFLQSNEDPPPGFSYHNPHTCSADLPSSLSYGGATGQAPAFVAYQWACCPVCKVPPGLPCPQDPNGVGPCHPAWFGIDPGPGGTQC